MVYHLAQINIGRLVAPLDDPRISGFVGELDPINGLAEDAPGFIWRLKSDSGNATGIPYSEDARVIVNMSVWDSTETLRDFVYSTRHVEIFKQRAKWFERMAKPHYCLWWIPAGHVPDVQEGKERLMHYQEHGATPYSFWFSREFPAPLAEEVCV